MTPDSDCHCASCDPYLPDLSNMRMIVCTICGNKRCPHAADHRNACTNSNEAGQVASPAPTVTVAHGGVAAAFRSNSVEQDAARYRFIRDSDDVLVFLRPDDNPLEWTGEAFDYFIDAARSTK